MTRYRRSGHRVRRSQIHLAGSAAAREVAILRAHHHLSLHRAHTGTRVDASPATWLDDVRSDLSQNFDVAALFAILSYLDRAELDEALHVGMNSLAASERFAKDTHVHVEVFLLARGARAAVCDVDLHRSRKLIN